HPGRVDDVGLPPRAVDEPRGEEVPYSGRVPPRHPVDGVRPRLRGRVRGRDDVNGVAAPVQEVGELRRVARGPTDVRRPDPRDDHDLHEVAAAGLCSRCSRRRATSHATANTPVAISTAAAAPVASQSEPRISTSGTRTTVSTPCVTIRSSGRPTDTGSDFVHAKTSATAP